MEKEIKNEKFDVILLAGQSNAEGFGLGDDKFDYIPDEDILIMRGEFNSTVRKSEYGNEYLDLQLSDEYKLSKADYLLDEKGRKRGCLAFTFAQEYKKNCLVEGRKILIIHAPIGGTGFAKNHWGIGDCVYRRMLKMVKHALDFNCENRLIAFLWHQGEHDSFENKQFADDEREEYYYRKLTAMIVNFRNKFGNVPFIAAAFTRQWQELYPNQCQAIYNATQRVIDNQGNATFITQTEDLKSNAEMVGIEDEVHFCKEALSVLGIRYYNEWIKLKNKEKTK